MLGALREDRGRSDGFLERILFAFPDPRPKPHWSDAGVPADATAAWDRIVQMLRSLPLEIDEDGRSRPRVVSFTPEAKAAWVAAYNAHVDGMNSSASYAASLAAEGKLADFAGRLVLILHLLELAAGPRTSLLGPIPPISRETVEKTVRLWNYFKSHQRRVRASMAGKGDADMPEGARLVRNWIANHPDLDQFSESDLSRTYPPSRGYESAMFEDGLEWLAAHHAIRSLAHTHRREGTKGRKPSPRWGVHPDLLARVEKQGFQQEPQPGDRADDSDESTDSPAASGAEATGTIEEGDPASRISPAA